MIWSLAFCGFFIDGAPFRISAAHGSLDQRSGLSRGLAKVAIALLTTHSARAAHFFARLADFLLQESVKDN
jgi:hypothetical protein